MTVQDRRTAYMRLRDVLKRGGIAFMSSAKLEEAIERYEQYCALAEKTPALSGLDFVTFLEACDGFLTRDLEVIDAVIDGKTPNPDRADENLRSFLSQHRAEYAPMPRPPARIPHERFGDLLVRTGVASREDVESAFRAQQEILARVGVRVTIGQLLLARKRIRPGALLHALSITFGLEYPEFPDSIFFDRLKVKFLRQTINWSIQSARAAAAAKPRKPARSQPPKKAGKAKHPEKKSPRR